MASSSASNQVSGKQILIHIISWNEHVLNIESNMQTFKKWIRSIFFNTEIFHLSLHIYSVSLLMLEIGKFDMKNNGGTDTEK